MDGEHCISFQADFFIDLHKFIDGWCLKSGLFLSIQQLLVVITAVEVIPIIVADFTLHDNTQGHFADVVLEDKVLRQITCRIRNDCNSHTFLVSTGLFGLLSRFYLFVQMIHLRGN